MLRSMYTTYYFMRWKIIPSFYFKNKKRHAYEIELMGKVKLILFFLKAKVSLFLKINKLTLYTFHNC